MPNYSFKLNGTEEEQKIALIRNEIDDISYANKYDGGQIGTDYFLTDARILAFVATATQEAPSDANEAEIRLFAASSCEATLAKNQAYVLKKAETLGRKDDGPAVGAEIRAHAKSLSDRAWKSLNDRRAKALEEEVEATPPPISTSRAIRLGW